jgi:hypothetical protein
VLAWALAACGAAQFGKLLVELVAHGRWRPAVLVETGGMPSSHAALVTGAAAGIGWELGFGDPLFAFAATTDAVEDRHFDALFDAYLRDPDTRDFVERVNAPALREMAARFQEARDRGLWRVPCHPPPLPRCACGDGRGV